MSSLNTNPQISQSLRVVLPIIYSIVAIIALIGIFIVLQIICANRFRHKALHLLIASLLIADLFFLIIFTIIRSVSYGYLSVGWFINPTEWCKAEMYLLRLFEFVLAYSIVFMCLDRAVRPGSCWFGVRKLRSGISIVVSIWIASAYILIPILLFKQTLFSQNFGGYLCYSTDASVPLFWLGAFPRRILDFIDIIFRVFLPILLMIILLVFGFINLRQTRNANALIYQKQYENMQKYQMQLQERQQKQMSMSTANTIGTPIPIVFETTSNNIGTNVNNNANNNNNYNSAASNPSSAASSITQQQQQPMVNYVTSTTSLKPSAAPPPLKPKSDLSASQSRLFFMVFGYALIFALCQLPFEIYRCVMLWNSGLENYLWTQSLDFAIEIPLLLLKLINRCINPFLFICLADTDRLARRSCRLWCLPCLPCCIGCNECWCKDCSKSMRYEVDYCLGSMPNSHTNDDEDWVPTGLQTISTHQYRDGDKLVTKQRILEEYETGVEPYYKNPELKEKMELAGVFNESFDNDDLFRLANMRPGGQAADEQRRVKL